MDGKFNHPELRRRLNLIRATIDSETERWADEGRVLQQIESGIAVNLQRQFEQIIESYKRNDSVTLDIELVDENPFVWQITYFGRPMTQLDGGMFKIIMCVSPRFPDEQPRATFETELFHHRVSKDGVFCYFPGNHGDLKSHVQAMIEALEDESPPYDPRTMVNPEAGKLFGDLSTTRRCITGDYEGLSREARSRCCLVAENSSSRTALAFVLLAFRGVRSKVDTPFTIQGGVLRTSH
jgi:ubiquitin-conjugating enzyme E2 Z